MVPDEVGASPDCIVVGAGDLVTWVNQTQDAITIEAGEDQLSAPYPSAAFSSITVGADTTATVRLIHADRVAYTSPHSPVIAGTILVLGRGSR